MLGFDSSSSFISQIVYPRSLIDTSASPSTANAGLRSFLVGWNLENFRCVIGCFIHMESMYRENNYNDLYRAIQCTSNDFDLQCLLRGYSKGEIMDTDDETMPVILGEYIPNISSDYVPETNRQLDGIWIILTNKGDKLHLHSLYSLGCLYTTSCYMFQYNPVNTNNIECYVAPVYDQQEFQSTRTEKRKASIDDTTLGLDSSASNYENGKNSRNSSTSGKNNNDSIVRSTDINRYHVISKSSLLTESDFKKIINQINISYDLHAAIINWLVYNKIDGFDAEKFDLENGKVFNFQRQNQHQFKVYSLVYNWFSSSCGRNYVLNTLYYCRDHIYSKSQILHKHGGIFRWQRVLLKFFSKVIYLICALICKCLFVQSWLWLILHHFFRLLAERKNILQFNVLDCLIRSDIQIKIDNIITMTLPCIICNIGYM